MRHQQCNEPLKLFFFCVKDWTCFRYLINLIMSITKFKIRDNCNRSIYLFI
jgi:hypothetical protein